MAKKHNDKIELIVVFKIEIDLEQAKKILENSGVNHREGMDSSRGKLYFYKTGPKFILTFQSQQDKDKFTSLHKDLGEIYELYTPDWEIQKD